MQKLKSFCRAFTIELEVLKCEAAYVMKHKRRRKIDFPIKKRVDEQQLIEKSRQTNCSASFKYNDKSELQSDASSSGEDDSYEDTIDEALDDLRQMEGYSSGDCDDKDSEESNAEVDNELLEIEIIEAEELQHYFDRVENDEQNIMHEMDLIDDWGDTAQTNMWSAYMSGITNVPANCNKPECRIRTLPTNAQGNYPVDKNEQLRRKSLHFGALKRNSTSSSIYEEVKLYLQTRLDTRDYSTSFDSGNSDDNDDQETLSYDVSFHEDREK